MLSTRDHLDERICDDSAPRSLGLGLLLLAWNGNAAEPLRTEGNVPIEIAFTAQRPHADPFHEVRLDVQVTAPDGTVKNVPAFWAGGAVWKVRYASPQTGLHRWRTACSDAQDAGLHGVAGTLDVQPYRGAEPAVPPRPAPRGGRPAAF